MAWKGRVKGGFESGNCNVSGEEKEGGRWGVCMRNKREGS